ncbi:extracellular solute-binding protein [candidate division KSB1 bacterium]|nr:extracellular solute-binding protein [candidate division KSB1 bacterium]
MTKVYYAGYITPTHQNIIDQFNATNDDQIEVVPINYLSLTNFNTNQRKELLIRALRSKNSNIDIVSLDDIWIARFAKWSEPLEKYFSMDELEELLPAALQSCFYGSHLVAIPFYIDVGLLYYRIDLLSNLPNWESIEQKLKKSITWEELLLLQKYFKGNKNPFFVFPPNRDESLMCVFWETIASQNRSRLLDKQIQIRSPEARKGLQFLVDLVNKYHVMPDSILQMNEAETFDYAIKNDAVFFRGWPGVLNDISINPDIDESKFGVAALPHFEGHDYASVLGGWNLMVSRHSRKKEAAVQFIKFITSQKIQEQLFEELYYFPVREAVYSNSFFIDRHPELIYFQKLLESGCNRPAMPDYTQVSDILAYHVHAAIRQEMSTDEALAQAQIMIEADEVLVK